MTHPAPTELAAFARGELEDTSAARIEAHLDACAACLDYVAQVPADALLCLAHSAVRAADGTLSGYGVDTDDPFGHLDPPTEVDFLRPADGEGELGRLGAYRVKRLIGSGGMGLVFAAEDTRLLRPVALKVLPPSFARKTDRRERFLAEARAVAAVEHDFIVPIYEVGEDAGVPYLAMPLLAGESLASRLRRQGRLPADVVRRIGRAVALGLAAAHARGVLHRDVKPSNIWLEKLPPPSESAERVRLLDFGLAHTVSESTQGLTPAGVVAGTPAYMAPEQVRGGLQDARSDLFSLGCVLYQALAGKPPFAGDGVVETLQAVATKEPPPLSKLAPQAPADLISLINALLAKDPAQRPASAAAVAERLAEAPPSRRWAWLAATLTLLVIVSVTGYAAYSSREARLIPPEASLPAEPLPGLAFGMVRQMIGHEHPWIEAVVWSADGRWIISGGFDQAVRLWDAETGRLVHTFVGHERAVLCLALHPDGRRVLSGGAEGVVRIWDLVERKLVKTLPLGADELHHFALAPDGNHLLVSTSRAPVQVWNLQTGSVVSVPKVSTTVSQFLAYAPNGKLWAAAGVDGSVRVWDETTGRERWSNRGHGAKAWCAAFSPDGRFLATGGSDNQVRLWDVTGGREVARGDGRGEWVRSVTFVPGGRLLTGGQVRHLLLWEWPALRLVCPVSLNIGAIDLHMSPDGSRCVSAGNDSLVRQWKLPPTDLPTLPFSAEAAARLQAKWAERIGAPVEVTNSMGMRLRLIPPGLLPQSAQSQAVLTRPYYLGSHEVTYAQFGEFVAATGYRTDAERSATGGWYQPRSGETTRDPGNIWRHPRLRGEPTLPAGQISSNDAMRFCAWLSAKEGVRYRLPTEAEWEWACRAGTDGPVFTPPKANLADYAWLGGNSGERPHPVGRLRPNAWGLFDVYGNVAEHCADWFGDFAPGTNIDPRGPVSGYRRVIRGRGWVDDQADSAARSYSGPDQSYQHFGFRVCREP